MILVSAFSQVGWTEEFAGYVRSVALLLGNPELSASAISALAYLSCRREGAVAIHALNIVPFLAGLRGTEYYGPLAEAILRNIGAA
jgi:hypothetical protein